MLMSPLESDTFRCRRCREDFICFLPEEWHGEGPINLCIECHNEITMECLWCDGDMEGAITEWGADAECLHCHKEGMTE